MEGEDYIYVNGESPYKGNILLDPDGAITRAELYDVLSELNRPVNITLQPTPLEMGAMGIAYGGFCVLVVLLVCALFMRVREHRGQR